MDAGQSAARRQRLRQRIRLVPARLSLGRLRRPDIDPAYRSQYYALFVQDDIKAAPRLTLNLGLRWDYETPRTERYDRMLRGFAFNQPSPIAGLKGGLLFAASGNRYAFDPHRR